MSLPSLGGLALAQKPAGKPDAAPPASLLANSGFEAGQENGVDAWNTVASRPLLRTDAEAHSGKYSIHCLLENEGKQPREGLLSQSVGDVVAGGQSYDFSFWIKQVSTGPSYVQQYQVAWRDDLGSPISDTGLVPFKGTEGKWVQVTVPDLEAPPDAADATILFRFVTGSVEGGHGEVYIDDVIFGSDAPASAKPKLAKPAVVQSLTIKAETIVVEEEKPKPVNPVVRPANPANPANPPAKPGGEQDDVWKRVEAVLASGIGKAKREALQQAVKDLGQLRASRRNQPEFREASELINLYYYSRASADQFERGASRWLARYPQSRHARDVLADTIKGQVQRAQYSAALTRIGELLKRFPNDPEKERFQLLQKRLQEFVAAGKERGVDF